MKSFLGLAASSVPRLLIGEVLEGARRVHRPSDVERCVSDFTCNGSSRAPSSSRARSRDATEPP